MSVGWFLNRIGRLLWGFIRSCMVGVAKGMGVFMLVLMGVAVNQVAVAMGMFMRVVMSVAVFMLMLQTHYFQAAAIAVSKVELVETGQVGVGKESLCAVVLNQVPLVQDQCAACQPANKEEVVADQDQGDVQAFENAQ